MTRLFLTCVVLLCIMFASFVDAQTKKKPERKKKEADPLPEYTVHQKQMQTPKGVNPARTIFDVALVFEEEPEVKVAYKAIVKEIKNITLRNGACDVAMYVFVGKENKQKTWVRLKDAEGEFVFATWTHATKKIMRYTKVIE